MERHIGTVCAFKYMFVRSNIHACLHVCAKTALKFAHAFQHSFCRVVGARSRMWKCKGEREGLRLNLLCHLRLISATFTPYPKLHVHYLFLQHNYFVLQLENCLDATIQGDSLPQPSNDIISRLSGQINKEDFHK